MEEVAPPGRNATGADAVSPAADALGPIGPPPFAERRSVAGSRPIRPPTPRVGLLLVAAIIVAIVLFLGRDALSPFIVGLLLVYLLDPAVERLEQLGLPRSAAILLVYVIVVVVVAELLVLAIPPLVQQIGQFFGDTPKLAALVQEQLTRLRTAYEALDIPVDVRAAIDRSMAQLGQSSGAINPGIVLPVFNSVAGLVASLFGYVIIPVWIFYLLKDRPSLTIAFDQSLPPEWREDTWAVIRIAERVFGQWVRGLVVLGGSVAIATFVGLVILGQTVDPVFARFALFLALLAGLLELLPIIGPIIAAVPVILLGATASPQATIAAFFLTLAIQQLENYFLVPKIQGDAVKLHPSAVMFSLIIGAAIAGLLGAILALPITATARDIYRYLFRRLSPPAAGLETPTPAEAFHGTLGEQPIALGRVGARRSTDDDAPEAQRSPERRREAGTAPGRTDAAGSNRGDTARLSEPS
jgi:predicted PurR-regulated permease PerM